MSCYEHEEGKIVIPSKEWSKFRKELIKCYNEDIKLKKNHLPLSKSCELQPDDVEWSIKLNNDNRTVYYSVPENNHACEYAREHKIITLMFKLLYNIKFSSRSGGIIFGNDEYNIDSDNGQYIKESYGYGDKYGRFS